MADLAITGPVGYRQFVLEHACEENAGHKHNYDHTTFVHRGSVRVTACKEQPDGTLAVVAEKEYTAGEFVYIPANLHHTIKALEDGTVYFCIFSHRDFDGLVTQKYAGNQAACC